MFNHIADAIKKPYLIQIDSNFYVARFESMKIYSTLYAVKKLLEQGKIDNNTTLIDSSSGVYAYALAIACHKYSLKCHIVSSSAVDNSIKLQLELLGAYVERVPSTSNLKMDQELRVEIVEKRLSENKNYYWMRQYHDNIHYDGYEEFANLIIKELNIKKLTVVGGVGSGCSTGATGMFLRNKGIDVNLCGLQPFGSISFGSDKIEDPQILVAGIGSSIDFLNLKHELYDYINWLSFDACLSGTIELMKKHAIFAGLSSGGCYLIAKNEINTNPNIPCLFIVADTGHRYINSVYNNYKNYQPLDSIKPKIIANAKELALPWSKFHWNRRSKEYLNDFYNLP